MRPRSSTGFAAALLLHTASDPAQLEPLAGGTVPADRTDHAEAVRRQRHHRLARRRCSPTAGARTPRISSSSTSTCRCSRARTAPKRRTSRTAGSSMSRPTALPSCCASPTWCRSSVARPVDGKPASVDWWLDGVAMDEKERARRKASQPPDIAAWNRQMDTIRIFDQLIYNMDRSQENLLIGNDWRACMIDHTRAFRKWTTLRNPAAITHCNPDLLRALKVAAPRRCRARPRRIPDTRGDRRPDGPPRPDPREAGIVGSAFCNPDRCCGEV